MSGDLTALLQTHNTIERNGIYYCKGLADKTVWDDLAEENPHHAVISAKNEADAAEKSRGQIEDIKRNVTEDTILLDLGSGYGRVAQYLLPQQKLKGYIAVDSAAGMLTLFKQRYTASEEEQKTTVLFLNADIHSLPVQNNSVDVVIVCAVFLHNHKDVVKRSLEELKRVVKPGGKILVYSSFPRSATAIGVQGHLYQLFLNLLGKPYKNGPVRHYRKKEIAALFSDFSEVDLLPHGFSVLPKTIIFLPSPLEKIYRLGFANPINRLLEKIMPESWKAIFAVHYDVVVIK